MNSPKAFTKDIKFVFLDPVGTFEGIPAIVEKIQATVGSLETQHALSTQIIELTGEKTAEATTYGTAVHFGTGQNEGKEVTAWGLYKDKLVKDASEGEGWRIFEREISFLGPFKGHASQPKM
ncbi:small subunit of phenylpropionate dioxygenase [Fusarium albosuccineum]|uniref:Small subunit of phenylpropionate dioxygenase n=1 Tax=Fusarium albosuccineum TaxID=1237068 RepID=A0A8H4PGU6_9HYPO|nr:small subunit of phenylpropionate dioxygenase [Fusarium albosuccineum]